MKNRFSKPLLISCLLFVGTTIAVQATTQSTPQQRLTNMKNSLNLSAQDQKILKRQSRGRATTQVGGKIVSTTDKISGYLSSSNFLTNIMFLAPLPFLNPVYVVGLLNNVVGVVGKGIEAYGGYTLRKATLATSITTMVDVNDLNAAAESLENIEALEELKSKVSNQKTVQGALAKAGSGINKKLFAALNPSHVKNTMKKFTDDLHLTDNRTKTADKLRSIDGKLQAEKAKYDAIINRLKLRFLNRMAVDLKVAIAKVKEISKDMGKYSQYKTSLENQIADAKGVKITERNPKKLKEKQARQDVFVTKLEARLKAFEGAYKNLADAEKELAELQKEMHPLSPQNTSSRVALQR